MSVCNKVIILSSHSKFREQCYRLLQYLSTFLKEYYFRFHSKKYWTINTFKRLEAHVSACRKLLRLGKFLESFRNAQDSINLHLKFDDVTTTLSHISMGCYFIFDNIGWINSIILNSINTNVSKTASRFWFLSLSCLILRDSERLYNLNKLSATKNIVRKKLIQDLLKNSLDLLVAYVSLKNMQKAKMWAAICGIISTLINLRRVYLSVTV